MIGIAILVACIDTYFLRSGILELPVGALFSAGVLCLMFGGVARWFPSKR
ncbi:MAG TPA: hypothetical protein VFA87_08570 [Rhizomicrobium sp.]|nr:hypothetical protein [Rhizomicrobium sp.]